MKDEKRLDEIESKLESIEEKMDDMQDVIDETFALIVTINEKVLDAL